MEIRLPDFLIRLLRWKPVQVLVAIPFFMLLPVFALIGISHEASERRKRRRLARVLGCPRCGVRLSSNCVAVAEARWAAIWRELPHRTRVDTIRCLDAVCGACGTEVVFEAEPNKSPEPASGTVTPRAIARVAPVPPVAHL
jgi:transcription elongation factor Elf1